MLSLNIKKQGVVAPRCGSMPPLLSVTTGLTVATAAALTLLAALLLLLGLAVLLLLLLLRTTTTTGGTDHGSG